MWIGVLVKCRIVKVLLVKVLPFLIGTQPHIVKQPFYIILPPKKKQMSGKQLNLLKKNKITHQVGHSVSCQLEYSGECLSPFTYKCHLLSSQGLWKVLLSPPWCAWQTFLPRLGDKLVMHSEKVRRNSMRFASGAFSLSSFSFYAPLVRCNLRIQTGVHRLCFPISLKDEAPCCLKACRSCNYWGGLMIGLLDRRGFVVVGELLIQNEWLQWARLQTEEVKWEQHWKTVWQRASCS